MIYRLTVSEEVNSALINAGKEKVRKILCEGLGLKHEEVRRGRPKKEAMISEEPVSKELEPNILKKSIVKVIVPELPKEKPVPSWKDKLDADRERIARDNAAKREKQTINHEPPPADDAPAGDNDEF